MIINKIIVTVVLILAILLSLKLAGTFESAPVISDLSVDNITYSSATVSWKTDKPALCWVDYGSNGDHGSKTEDSSVSPVAHCIVIDGLLPDATYTFSPRSKDSFGKVTIGGDKSFQTAHVPRMAYVSKVNDHDEIFVVNMDGTNKKQLTYGRIYDIQYRSTIFDWDFNNNKPANPTSDKGFATYNLVRWSSNGTKLYFTSQNDTVTENSPWDPNLSSSYWSVFSRPTPTQLYVVDYDGHNMKRLTNGGGWSLSPDNKKIIYEINPDADSKFWVEDPDANCKIWIKDIDDSNQRYLCDGEILNCSPDSQRVAFLCKGSLDVIDLSGRNKIQLTDNIEVKSNYDVSWSPDGQYVVYWYNESLNIMKLDPGRKIQLDSTMKWGSFPDIAWSPDEKRIAFFYNNDTFYLVGLDNSSESQFTLRFVPSQSRPIWSPDGNKVVFVSDLSNSVITVVDKDGNNRIKLSDIRYDTAPFWSPDSRRIAYVADDGCVNVINSDGSNRRRINKPNDPGYQYLAWSHRGDLIAGAGSGIGLMSPDGNKDPIILIRPDPYEKYEHVSWANDDKKIIYRYSRIDQRYQDNNGAFTGIMDADGSNVVRYDKGEDFVCSP